MHVPFHFPLLRLLILAVFTMFFSACRDDPRALAGKEAPIEDGDDDNDEDPLPVGVNPAVLSVTGENGSFNIGDVIHIEVKFDMPVTVTGTPTLLIENGAKKKLAQVEAVYDSGSGTDTLVFEYTVAGTDDVDGLDYVGTDSLDLEGGTIKSVAGLDATITLPTPGATGSLSETSTVNLGREFVMIDGGGANSPINVSSASSAYNPKLAYFNGSIYAVWMEQAVIQVSRYNGTTWDRVDGGGINYDINGLAPGPLSVVVWQNNLYVAWTEGSHGMGPFYTRVKKFDGTTWTGVSDGAEGLDYSPNGTSSVQIVATPTTLYAVWLEHNGSNPVVRAKKYNGTTWTSADNGTTGGINIDTNENSEYLAAATTGEYLCIVWVEGARTRAAIYDGSVWTNIDGAGPDGLNKNPAEFAMEPKIAADSSGIYATWLELDGVSSYDLRVAKYSNSNWSFIDGNGVNGLNYVAGSYLYAVDIHLVNGSPYLAWTEDNGGDKAHMRKLVGATWEWMESNPADGFNFNPIYHARTPHILSFETQMWIGWSEDNSVGDSQFRVASFN